MRSGFSDREEAMNWICSKIEASYFHFWCSRHYLVDGKPYRLGNLTCDLSDLPEVPTPQ